MVETQVVNGSAPLASAPAAAAHWQAELQPLLDDYLRRIGVRSVELRARWVARVLAGLFLNSSEFAADDIAEKAIEKLRDAVDARLAQVAGYDRVHQRRDIAAVLAILQREQHAGLVDALLGDTTDSELGELRGRLQAIVRAERPHPVPPEAPLAMPRQTIQLRVLNPLRHLFGTGR